MAAPLDPEGGNESRARFEVEPDPAPGAALRGTRAPDGTSFETTRVAVVPIGELAPIGLTEPVFLKLSLDPDGLRSVYLGRAPEAGATLSLSLPRVTQTLYYEIYDAAGHREAGALEAP